MSKLFVSCQQVPSGFWTPQCASIKLYSFGCQEMPENQQWFPLSSLPSTPPGSKAQGQMMLPRLCNQGPNRTTTVNQGYEGLPGMPFNPHGHEKKINKFSHQIKFFQPRPKPQVDQLLGEEESRDTLQPINGSYVLSNRTTIVSNRSSNVRNQPRYKPQHMLRRKEQVHSPDFLSNTLRTTSYTNLLEEEIVDEFTAFGK